MQNDIAADNFGIFMYSFIHGFTTFSDKMLYNNNSSKMQIVWIKSEFSSKNLVQKSD